MSIPQLDLTTAALGNVLSPLVAGGLGFILLMFRRHLSLKYARNLLGGLTVGASLISLLLSVYMVLHAPSEAQTPVLVIPWVGKVGFLIDSLSLYFVLLVNIVAFGASWNAIGFLAGFERELGKVLLFDTLVNLFHFTMLLVPLVDNLIALWIAIEATTLVSTLLVSFLGERRSWEAAWKYLIVTSTGIIFALLGTMFLANAAKGLIPILQETGDPNSVMNWTFLLANADKLSPDFVKLSFLFIVVGYGTKAGLAPMHTWLPDGHGEAPAPISALLSGVLLKSALYAILRFYTITNTRLGDPIFASSVLLVMGVFSLILATPFILQKENPFKRVLAYHSLEHMGIIAFGIGIGGPIALFGALLHALNHAVTKSLMFLAFGNIINRYNKAGVSQKAITGVLQSMPITGTILSLGGLALVGTPPFNIFMSEFIILWGALGRLGRPPIAGTPQIAEWIVIGAVVIFIVTTTLIFYGLVRHLAKLVLHAMPEAVAKAKEQGELREGLFELVPLVLLLGLAVLFGLWVWPPLSTLIDQSVRIILFRFS